MGIKSYAADLSTDGMSPRVARKQDGHNKRPQAAVALGALAAASVAAGTTFYFWPSGEQAGGTHNVEELPMARALLWNNADPPRPSISFQDPLVPAGHVGSRAPKPGSSAPESYEAERSPAPSEQSLATRPSAGRGGSKSEERAVATARPEPNVEHVASDLRLADIDPRSPSLIGLHSVVDPSPKAEAGGLALPRTSGQSTLSAPAASLAQSAGARFLRILEGIVASDSAPVAGQLSAEVTAGTASSISLSAGPSVTSPTASGSPGDVADFRDVSAEIFPAALGGPIVSAPSVGGQVELAVAPPTGNIDRPKPAGRHPALVNDAARSTQLMQSSPVLDELGEGITPIGADDQGEDFLAARDGGSGKALAAAPEGDEQGGAGVRSPPLAGGEEERLTTMAPPPLANDTVPFRSPAQARAQPGLARSDIIREDDRVAFARSESGETGPDQVSADRMATVSLASPAEWASEKFVDDGPKALTRIPLADAGDGIIQLRLGDLIALLEDRMERPLFVWLSSAETASKYVTFDTLRAAGIGVEYDPLRSHVILSVSAEEGE